MTRKKQSGTEESRSGHGVNLGFEEKLQAAAKSPEIDKVIAQATHEIARELPSLNDALPSKSVKRLPKTTCSSAHPTVTRLIWCPYGKFAESLY